MNPETRYLGFCTVDVVFEGSLSKSWGMKDVLQAILAVPNVPFGLLRVSSTCASLQGKILISNSSHIVGASSSFKTDRDAYDALRSILELKDGTFAYLDYLSDLNDPIEMDRSLYISISHVLDTIPQLPDDSSLVFDQQGLLDSIFGPAAEQTSMPAIRETRFELPCPIPKNHAKKPVAVGKTSTVLTKPYLGSSAPITQWNVVEPLLDQSQVPTLVNAPAYVEPKPPVNNGPQTGPPQFDPTKSSSMIAAYVHTPDEQRASVAKLRAVTVVPEPANWQEKPFKWLLSALGINS